MRVRHRDPDLLCLEDRGILLRSFGLLFLAGGIYDLGAGGGDPRWEGLGAVLVGLGFLVLVPVIRLRLDRRTGRATLSRHTVFGARVRWAGPLADLRGARMDPSTGADAEGTWRIHLLLASGPLPVTPWHSSGYGGKQKAVDAINEWLHST